MQRIDDLQGKAVLVTGASTGIGAAVARAFGGCGARVAVHYNRSRAQADQVAADIERAGGKALTFAADLSDAQAARALVAQAIDALGRIDVLVNNAGSLIQRRQVADIDDDLLAQLVALNMQSVVTATVAALPQMRKQGGGNVINVTSVAARNGGGPGATLYAASKGFVSTLTRGWARELAPDRIRVNAVAPGVIATPLHEKFSTEAQIESMRAGIPMQRLGTAEECAGAFLYLASDALSSYVTGQIIEVNGGQLMP